MKRYTFTNGYRYAYTRSYTGVMTIIYWHTGNAVRDIRIHAPARFLIVNRGAQYTVIRGVRQLGVLQSRKHYDIYSRLDRLLES